MYIWHNSLILDSNNNNKPFDQYKEPWSKIFGHAYYKHRFYERLGQKVEVAKDWYRHMDDLGENEVPVLVTSCDEYGMLIGTDGEQHGPDRCDEGFFVSSDYLADPPAPPDPHKKRIDLTQLCKMSSEDDTNDNEQLD